MKPKRIPSNIKLSSGDVEAIICALPLVSNIEADTPEQTHLNITYCNIAAEKLLSRTFRFEADELRVIGVAIEFALEVISGNGKDIAYAAGVDAQWMSNLSRNFFTYNRLRPLFSSLLDLIEDELNI